MLNIKEVLQSFLTRLHVTQPTEVANIRQNNCETRLVNYKALSQRSSLGDGDENSLRLYSFTVVLTYLSLRPNQAKKLSWARRRLSVYDWFYEIMSGELAGYVRYVGPLLAMVCKG